MNISSGPSSENSIDEIDLMVSQNISNLENLGEDENIEIHDDEIEDEASPGVSISSRYKKARRSERHGNVSKLSMAV